VDCEEEEEEDDDHEESIEEKVGRDRIGISLLSYIPSWRKFSVLIPGKHRSRERSVLITVIPTGTVGFIDIPNSFCYFFSQIRGYKILDSHFLRTTLGIGHYHTKFVLRTSI
jgi:hypothetical protein